MSLRIKRMKLVPVLALKRKWKKHQHEKLLQMLDFWDVSNTSNYSGTVGPLQVMCVLSTAWISATQHSLLLVMNLGAAR